jgi:type VI secretion system protein ImpG
MPVGFAAEEAVLPYPRQAHAAYRLLQEYFTFPEKFLFFDLQHLEAHASHTAFYILFLLTRPPNGLAVDRHTFCLGCTPIINLIRKTTEPIRLDHRTTDYRLIPDLGREPWTEIHSICSVSASSTTADATKAIEPFFSFNHHLAARDHKAFWHARRVPSSRPDLPGTDLLLSFVDLDFTPAQPATQTVYVHTLCTNRDLAEHLPAGAILQVEEAAPLARISCLSKPTLQLAPTLEGGTLWRLISHLSLNHLSLRRAGEPASTAGNPRAL